MENGVLDGFRIGIRHRAYPTLSSRIGDRLRVRISDNGKGLPAENREARPGFGTGRALIEGLARQIGAVPEWRSANGTALSLEFPYRT